MVQDEGHTKDEEVASIGPYTNYLTLLFLYIYSYIRMMLWMKKMLKWAIDLFLNGADMVVEEDQSDREGII